MRRAILLTPLVLLLPGCGDKGGFTTYNTPPNAVITSPPDGSEYAEGEAVTFLAQVQDEQDAEETLRVQWTSDIDGVLADGINAAEVVPDASGMVTWSTANLAPGNHVISLTVLDNDGESGSASITLTVTDVTDEPEINPVHPVGGEYGVEDEAFEFVAQVSDNQDAAEDLEVSFSSDVDGEFCAPTPDPTGVVGCEAILSVGDHYLSYVVTDASGNTDEVELYFPVVSADGVDNDGDGFNEVQGDCDDTDPDINPIADEVLNTEDDDCDGDIDEGTDYYDDDGDGYTESDGDCDDGNANINPDATETCDNFDQDCDDTVDEETACYDDDGDGFAETASDCDDDDATSYPGGYEVADGADNDCDTEIDEGTDGYDDDGDGYAEDDGDCDDDDDTIHPGAREDCDGVDNNCDGTSDEEDSYGCTLYYPDVDGDSYGDEDDDGACLCGTSGVYSVTNHSDCFDENSDARPSQSSWFSSDRGDGSYDYNCDDDEDVLYADVYTCNYELAGFSLECVESEGWEDAVAPCGGYRTWATGCEFSISTSELFAIVFGSGDLTGIDFCSATSGHYETQQCR